MDKIILNYNYIVYTHDSDILLITSWADLEYIKCKLYRITDLAPNINCILEYFNNTNLIFLTKNFFYVSQFKINKKNNYAAVNNWINYKCDIDVYNRVQIKNINDIFSSFEDMIYNINIKELNHMNIQEKLIDNFTKRINSKHSKNTEEYYYELWITYNNLII